MITPNQKNIKIHYAGGESPILADFTLGAGMRYLLYTAYPFIINSTPQLQSQGKKVVHLLGEFKGTPEKIPQYLSTNAKHVIQDSGLFTLMFGSEAKESKDKSFLDTYLNRLIQFSNEYSVGITLVEMDVQKVLGVAEAWEYRMKLRNESPNRIINVFHKEDGIKGLDRLIEFSDYIAISVPELRFLGKKLSVIPIAHYIKNKKPEIDIHLLGCTEVKLLQELRFCTSADSTSYTSGVRYGFIKNNHVSRVKEGTAKRLMTRESYESVTRYNSEKRTNTMALDIYLRGKDYEMYAGPQD